MVISESRRVQVPQLDIQTVAAGGGSILSFRGGLLSVGPESASAFPGPACYRRGGPATVTDANLVLGRIRPEYFPKIFGPSENEPLDRDASYAKIGELAEEINRFENNAGRAIKSVEMIAEGFIKVANEAMCRPIRNLTQVSTAFKYKRYKGFYNWCAYKFEHQGILGAYLVLSSKFLK